VFPVAIKPRGHGLHLTTANTLGFKVRYARSLAELQRLLQPFERDAHAVLVQEYAPGVGRCVAALCRHGEPIALFAYSREREFPLSGGVSVVRKSIPLDERLAAYTTALLRRIAWHGVAMVEFKYDRAADRYTLMEINGRFQASTALSLDAGINLPRLVGAICWRYATGSPASSVGSPPRRRARHRRASGCWGNSCATSAPGCATTSSSGMIGARAPSRASGC